MNESDSVTINVKICTVILHSASERLRPTDWSLCLDQVGDLCTLEPRILTPFWTMPGSDLWTQLENSHRPSWRGGPLDLLNARTATDYLPISVTACSLLCQRIRCQMLNNKSHGLRLAVNGQGQVEISQDDG